MTTSIRSACLPSQFGTQRHTNSNATTLYDYYASTKNMVLKLLARFFTTLIVVARSSAVAIREPNNHRILDHLTDIELPDAMPSPAQPLHQHGTVSPALAPRGGCLGKCAKKGAQPSSPAPPRPAMDIEAASPGSPLPQGPPPSPYGDTGSISAVALASTSCRPRPRSLRVRTEPARPHARPLGDTQSDLAACAAEMDVANQMHGSPRCTLASA